MLGQPRFLRAYDSSDRDEVGECEMEDIGCLIGFEEWYQIDKNGSCPHLNSPHQK